VNDSSLPPDDSSCLVSLERSPPPRMNQCLPPLMPGLHGLVTLCFRRSGPGVQVLSAIPYRRCLQVILQFWHPQHAAGPLHPAHLRPGHPEHA